MNENHDEKGRFTTGEGGGLGKGAVNSKAFKEYEGGFGYKYHEARTTETDKQLTQLMKQQGLNARQQGKFVVSRYGRHAGDSLVSGRLSHAASSIATFRQRELGQSIKSLPGQSLSPAQVNNLNISGR